MPLFGDVGERIGYRVFEHPAEAPPIILLHGFTASSVSFLNNIDALRERFTVVTVDLLGHGASDSPDATGPYEPGPAVDRVIALMDYLGYRQALICGHSLGGALALRIALDHPARVAGLVVINSNSCAGTPEWRARMQPGMVQMAKRLRTEGTAFLKNTRLYPAHSKRLPEDARELLKRGFDRLTPQGVAGTAEGLIVNVNAFERLGSLQVPFLVVIGDRDTPFVESAPAMIAAAPQELVRTVTLAGAGHAANLEQPGPFVAAVTRFAADLGYIEEAAALPAEKRAAGRSMLTVTGICLLSASIAMLAGAYFMTRDDGGSTVRSAAPAAVNDVAGARATPSQTRPAQVSQAAATAPGPAQTATVAAPSPSQAAQQAAAVQPTPVTPQPTEAQPKPSPTAAVASTTAASTAAGVILQGPSSVTGRSAGFGASPASGNFLKISWSASGGATLAPASGALTTATFPAKGCYTVTATVLLAGGKTATASQAVAVDGATC